MFVNFRCRIYSLYIEDDAETNAKLAEEKATVVAAKKKERSELRGELKKRQSKYEKEHAENSQKLICTRLS